MKQNKPAQKLIPETKLPLAELWKLLKKIPKGKVSTYKAVAKKLNLKNPRNVGWMLRNNPYAPLVPCHRIIASSGHIGGFCGTSAGKEITRKIKLLKSEGIEFSKTNRISDPGKIISQL